MKKILKLKKGFTLVEIIVVIVIIGILASIIITGYTGYISKAKLSADQVAVKEMNLLLETDEILNGKPIDAAGLKEVLLEGGFNDKLSPVSRNHKFFWDVAKNRVVLVNTADNSVVFPKGASFVANNANYVPLDGIPTAKMRNIIIEEESLVSFSMINNMIKGLNIADTLIKLDTVVGFSSNETESLDNLSYGELVADFRVTFSKEIDCKFNFSQSDPTIEKQGVGFFLVGDYTFTGSNGATDEYNWVALPAVSGIGKIENGTQIIRVVRELMGINDITYKSIVESFGEFKCGIKPVYVTTDGTSLNFEFDFLQMPNEQKDFLNGLNIKVELCLYEKDPNDENDCLVEGNLIAVVNTFECEYKVVGDSLELHTIN